MDYTTTDWRRWWFSHQTGAFYPLQ